MRLQGRQAVPPHAEDALTISSESRLAVEFRQAKRPVMSQRWLDWGESIGCSWGALHCQEAVGRGTLSASASPLARLQGVSGDGVRSTKIFPAVAIAVHP